MALPLIMTSVNTDYIEITATAQVWPAATKRTPCNIKIEIHSVQLLAQRLELIFVQFQIPDLHNNSSVR